MDPANSALSDPMDYMDGGAGADIASALQAADEMQGIPQPDVELHQQHYVRYRKWQEARLAGEWTVQESMVANATKNTDLEAMPRQLLRCSMRLVQAPAAFARPLVQRKLFRPPFKVQLDLTYRGPLDTTLVLEAVTLVDTQFARPSSWRPEQQQQQQQLSDLENGIHHRQIMLPDPGDDEEHTQTEVFDFMDLRFIKSSRMSKRWLAFVLHINEDMHFLIYMLPTVIISRRTDQYSKAFETLTGTPPVPPKRPGTRAPPLLGGAGGSGALAGLLQPGLGGMAAAGGGGAPWAHFLQQQQQAQLHAAQPATPAELLAELNSKGLIDDQAPQPAVLDVNYLAGWVTQRYAASGLNRPLTATDFEALNRAAGMPPLRFSDDPNDERHNASRCTSAEDWGAFREWFWMTLRLLQACKMLWERHAPTVMCGFGVDRRTAELALAGKEDGTFLVRVCEEPGTVVISLISLEDGVEVFDHVLLDCEDLQARPLGDWIAVTPQAVHLLDPDSGQSHPKELVFTPSQGSLGVAPSLDSRGFSGAFPAAATFGGAGAFDPYSAAQHRGAAASPSQEPGQSFGGFQRRALLRRSSASAPAQFGNIDEDPAELLSFQAAALSAARNTGAGPGLHMGAPNLSISFPTAPPALPPAKPDIDINAPFRPGMLLRDPGLPPSGFKRNRG